MKRLTRRKALITGGSRGIGRAIALRFAQEGCDVAICHVGDGENAAETVERVQALGQNIISIEANVADPQAVEAMVTEAVSNLGQIDILVNNAGVEGTSPFEALSIEAWDRVMNVNLRGLFW